MPGPFRRSDAIRVTLNGLRHLIRVATGAQYASGQLHPCFRKRFMMGTYHAHLIEPHEGTHRRHRRWNIARKPKKQIERGSYGQDGIRTRGLIVANDAIYL